MQVCVRNLLCSVLKSTSLLLVFFKHVIFVPSGVDNEFLKFISFPTITGSQTEANTHHWSIQSPKNDFTLLTYNNLPPAYLLHAAAPPFGQSFFCLFVVRCFGCVFFVWVFFLGGGGGEGSVGSGFLFFKYQVVPGVNWEYTSNTDCISTEKKNKTLNTVCLAFQQISVISLALGFIINGYRILVDCTSKKPPHNAISFNDSSNQFDLKIFAFLHWVSQVSPKRHFHV